MPNKYYIVPAWSDQAGQCRIVVRSGFQGSARDNYRLEPEKWKEAGIMNSQGRLVCLTAGKNAQQEFKDCEPLAAGLEIESDD